MDLSIWSDGTAWEWVETTAVESDTTKEDEVHVRSGRGLELQGRPTHDLLRTIMIDD